MTERVKLDPGRPERVSHGAYRAVVLSSLGGALEFYDFIIFGTFAAYLSKEFFPTQSSTLSLLFAFAVFGAGYLARPIGGLLFGIRGDSDGRRNSFVLSLVIMSGATFAIGLLPSYETAGIIATLAFVVLRLLQGFSLGGELPGAITYVVEVAPKKRTTLACGIVFGCVSSGVLIATGISAVLHATLTPGEMQSYGWRLAFLIGGGLGIIGWWMRRALGESQEFLRIKKLESAAVSSGNPFMDLVGNHRRRILAAIGTTCVVATFNGLLFAHMPAYLSRVLGYSSAEIALALNVASGAMAVSVVIACWMGDRVPRRIIFRTGCIVIGIGALPAYQALASHLFPLWLIFLLIGLSAACTHGTFAAILADLFPVSVRFSGIAMSLNLGSIAFSGLAPFTATALINVTGRQESPAFLVAVSALLAFVTSLTLVGLEGRIAGEPAHDTSIEPATAQEIS